MHGGVQSGGKGVAAARENSGKGLFKNSQASESRPIFINSRCDSCPTAAWLALRLLSNSAFVSAALPGWRAPHAGPACGPEAAGPAETLREAARPGPPRRVKLIEELRPDAWLPVAPRDGHSSSRGPDTPRLAAGTGHSSSRRGDGRSLCAHGAPSRGRRRRRARGFSCAFLSPRDNRCVGSGTGGSVTSCRFDFSPSLERELCGPYAVSRCA